MDAPEGHTFFFFLNIRSRSAEDPRVLSSLIFSVFIRSLYICGFSWSNSPNMIRNGFINGLSRQDAKALADADFEDSIREIVKIVRASNLPEVVTPSIHSVNYPLLNPATYAYNVPSNIEARQPRKVRRDSTRVDWLLPGHGEPGRADVCGHTLSLRVCPNGHSVKAGRWFCGNPSCPFCFDHWSRETDKAEARLWAAVQLLGGLPSGFGFSHIVLSPPPEAATDAIQTMGGFAAFRENAYRIAASMGIVGGIDVFHPFRMNKGQEDADATAGEALGPAPPSSYKAVWRWGPHLHMIGICDPERVKELTAAIHKATGWIVKVIGDPLEVEGAVRVLQYALTHAGIGTPRRLTKAGRPARRMKCLNYFGIISFQRLAVFREDPDSVPVVCEECNAPIVDYDAAAAGFEEPHTIKKPIFTFCRREQLAGLRLMYGAMGRAEFLEASVKDPRLFIVCTPSEIKQEANLSEDPPRGSCGCRRGSAASHSRRRRAGTGPATGGALPQRASGASGAFSYMTRLSDFLPRLGRPRAVYD